MDNSSLIGRETVGKKRTSSGYLPPEQAAVVAFERSTCLPSPASPVSAVTSRNDSHGVKRFVRSCLKPSLLEKVEDKPKDVIASSQYDMWCFGALLYFLCTGKQLFNVDTKEDVDDEDLIILREWDDAWKYEKLSKVDSKWPVYLLDALLQKEPTNRPENWKYIVDELNRLRTTEENYDRLFVFQSSPLVFKDKNNDIQPLPRVDFNQESHMLCEALKDAEKIGCTIDVVFETASLDRLNAFLAKGISQVMHFSGHGHPNYIAFEDERGALEMVDSEALKRMVSAVDDGLLVVFISACHSEWVGSAFVDAGVPHAVCCLVNERLQDAAAIEFTRNFYRALACQNSLLKAFNMAKQAVQNSPKVLNSDIEADKFILLPKNPDDPSYHDVPVFFSSEILSVQDESLNQTKVVGLPKYKDLLVGREVQQYSILTNLYTADVVRVYGKAGLGKKSIIAAVCGHILQRPRSYSFDYILWFPSKGSMDTTFTLFQNIASFIALMIDDRNTRPAEESLKEIWHSITEIVSDKSLLLVIDLRDYDDDETNKNSTSKQLHHAVNELLKISTTGCIKIVLIAEKVSMGWNPTGGEKHVPIWELDFESAVTLFARNVPLYLRHRHPLLNSPDELISYICYPPEKIQDDKDYERREEELWNLFGAGVPSACIDNAKSSSEGRILQLLTWWEKPDEHESHIPLDELFL